MIQRLLLLTGAFDASQIGPFLLGRRPNCEVHHVDSLLSLERAVAEGTIRTRLLSFCTSVIVPNRILARMPGPSYNVHPGPPSFPGRHPEVWGAYQGVRRFGATLHEMAPRVDEGAIIDVVECDVDVPGAQMGVAMPAYRSAYNLILKWGEWLAGDEAALPRSAHRWSGHKTTRAEMQAMLRFGPEISAEELERRHRAFAEAPGSKMTVVLHGREFVYVTPGEVEAEE